MDNIKIEPDKLQETLVKLIQDNNDILETIKAINDDIRLLDDSVWLSPEKTKMDENLLPYIESRYNMANVTLNNCTDVIYMALEKYIETNNIVLEKSSTLENYRNIMLSRNNITIGEPVVASDNTNEEVL